VLKSTLLLSRHEKLDPAVPPCIVATADLAPPGVMNTGTIPGWFVITPHWSSLIVRLLVLIADHASLSFGRQQLRKGFDNPHIRIVLHERRNLTAVDLGRDDDTTTWIPAGSAIGETGHDDVDFATGKVRINILKVSDNHAYI